MKKRFNILAQPNDTTCGPTCLHSLYRYYGEKISLAKIISEIEDLEQGGTLAVMLGLHALKKNYEAKIYTYNLKVFDPTWFATKTNLVEKLKKQMRVKSSRKLRTASKSYIEFLELGGKIVLEDLTRSLLQSYLERGTPILTGLSSTYLYSAMREIGETCKDDDIEGEPTGHFVILHSYDKKKRTVSIADPYPHNPMSKNKNYSVHIDRVIGAVLLGIVTYDANLLIIEPKAD